jgi:glutamate synthase (NADPH/NADH) large chain
VPINRDALGATARATAPEIHQVLVLPPPRTDAEQFEGLLYRARKKFQRSASRAHVCSLSCRTLVYKALCVGGQLAHIFEDLEDPLYESALAVFHQRYSTNTLPSWPLAQPFRFLAHNGEINTLWANRSWMRAREALIPSELRPVLTEQASDSANLDEAFELLLRGGRSAEHSLSMLIPPAWEETGDALPEGVREFFRAHAPLMEPWDGPSALAFSDGRFVGAALDRNGLRPCRYKVTRDGLVVAGSEAGVLALDDDEVLIKGRLGPGEMIGVDLEARRLLSDNEIKARLAEHCSHDVQVHLAEAPIYVTAPPEAPGDDALLELQHAFGYSREDVDQVLSFMAEEGKEPTWSMGDDTPIAPLARARRPVYDFFRQRFAQVTNPAIDSLRETRVMSLRTLLGPRPSPLHTEVADLIELSSPVLSITQAAWLRKQTVLRTATLTCAVDLAGDSLSAALDRVCAAAEELVGDGAELLILSDRDAPRGTTPLPMALVVGAVHHHLIRAGLRVSTSLAIEAGDCSDIHQLAVLVGYGADAICPWLAIAVARSRDADAGEAKLIGAMDAGLRKVMSKMGISTVASYRAGQTFEVLGLADDVVDRCFTGTPSLIGGLDFLALEEKLRERRDRTVARDVSDEGPGPLVDLGKNRFRRHDEAEHHAWEPAAARALQRAVGSAKGKDYGTPNPAAWEEFRGGVAFPRVLRDLLDLIPAAEPIPLEAVEPAEAIVKRFFTSGMSLGALSPEAHRTLAIAMNRLGARSNSGEGGEDPAAYDLPQGEERVDAKIKQVASGRFGVTIEYLSHADELEIKVAQGSKPGEGGQLGGHKVSELIAKLRHTQPGVPLISPPPHHDIYSIEDLAQLIYDLKRANPRAKVGVKLVAEAGVGTIAAGVAKAYADYVHIAGHSGGTGASPLSSIKHAGSPWELGLSETQQVLMRNALRSRIRVRTDGGLMNGRDVVIAALMGAEEFGFGTAALVSIGCDMARQCHLDTCPTGIATQRPELRAKFRGRPEQVMRYFLAMAEEVRELLAWLGLASIDDAVGRVELLRQTRAPGGLDLTRLLAAPESGAPRRCTQERNDRPATPEEQERVSALTWGNLPGPHDPMPIHNRDRTVGARLSGELAWRGHPQTVTKEGVELHFRGSAGQSFGAFGARGMRLVLTGEANDYVGKGLSGAELVLKPAGLACDAPHENVILGNVALYGATSGRLFAGGTAGERFAIRNSGADAVVEGLGDHGCEYMTGGRVVVIGEVGWNFGAGMTGGEAYVLDEHGKLGAHLNAESVSARAPSAEELEILRGLLEEHLSRTGSVRAAALLEGWSEYSARFRKVAPAVAVALGQQQGSDATSATAAAP